jgi:alpha-glucosidase
LRRPRPDRGAEGIADATRSWWEHGIIYHIYPRSFQDSDGDGVGDLPGIVSRLGYLQWLGVDAVWLSPIYPSPMADFGYDISDHTAVDPVFGTLADFDALIARVGARGIRVVLDYVPNHTSDRHPWFLESRSSRENPQRDWYLWRDANPEGGSPNNWLSNFGGSAWSRDDGTGQFYYHAYLPEQPDLNWRNPAVRRAMLDVLRFWLDRGVDGFRIDALRQLVKDSRFRDNPPNPDWKLADGPYKRLLPLYSADRPETLEHVLAMRRLADGYGDKLLIGELYLEIERLIAYYGTPEAPACHLPSNFHLISTPWRAEPLGALIERYEAALPPHGWPNWVLGNHDKPRIASRIGAKQARVAAMLLLTLRGTPTVYYGDELGMEDVPIPPAQVQDPWEKRVPGKGLGRDPERTPMQWDASPGAGFTTGVPWLPLAADFQHRNVERQRDQPGSMLSLYRRLIGLRRGNRAFTLGSYATVAAAGPLLAFLRTHGDQRFLVALNLSDHECALPRQAWPRVDETGTVALSTHCDRTGETVRAGGELRANEGVIVTLGT